MQIIHYRAKCKLYGEVLESYSVHDFKMCSCGSLGVDGGHDYLRRVCATPDCYEELSECREDEES